MNQSRQQEQRVRLSVENIGGISDTTVEFEPGVTVLSGRNATNRTSLLRAIIAALGSDDVSLKSDADEGHVEMVIDAETYTRRLIRNSGTVTSEGNPYLGDPELGNLFAFLLATNETRQAVLTDQDLREIIMRPIDTRAIKNEIESLKGEKARLDEELTELSRLKDELPELEEERRDVEARIDEKEAELEAKREEIEQTDASVDESPEEKRELDEKMSELSDVRSQLDEARQELRAQRDSLDSLEEKREELELDAADLPDAPAGEIDEIDERIDDLRDRKQSLQSEINTLQRIIQFNQDNLDGTSTEILQALTGEAEATESGEVTDKLLDSAETVVCWTCGHEVDREDIEETLERLRDLRKEKMSESRAIDDQIDELKDERDTYEEKQRQREQIQRQLRQKTQQIEDREEQIESLEERRDALEAEVEEIEESVQELQTQQNDTILSLHKEENQLEVDLNRLQREREDVIGRIAEIESELERREGLEDRRADIEDELADLRTRIEQIATEAIESFNHHMETVLDVLEYDNLARIWIERTETKAKRGREKVTESEFTLHIVRESESGAAYEDTIDHLSESEREVTGLIFALAGYLVHDVHETVPFMLLDSVEAIDSDRIAKLIDYFEDYPDYLVAALLPEDAAATSDSYPVINQI